MHTGIPVEKNKFNLNISRYVSNIEEEETINLLKVSEDLIKIEEQIKKAKNKHNQFLKELGLPELQ